jgi:pyruvate dehydrogenase E2 component (dihydrolipoamide acetyltransferase)
MKILTMPSFGADMAKGSIAQWNVKPGDHVSKGDIIASIETMKGLIDMEVFDDGTIVTLLAGEGDDLEIGHAIAELQLTNEKPSNNKPLQSPDDNAVHQNEYRQNTQQPKISPAARIKAQQLGIDWRSLSQGTGPDGALLLNDINVDDNVDDKDGDKDGDKDSDKDKDKDDDNDKDSDKPKLEQSKIPNDTMREAIAANVSLSNTEIPHYYLQLDMSLDNALHWLSQHNAGMPPNKRILINAVIYSAIARALAAFAAFNGFYRDGHYEPSYSVHLGNAISLRQGGLMVAAIHDAQRLGLVELMEKIKDQVNRAKKGELRISELQDATVTVSSLGDRGVDSIQSIIFPPQVAIFGIGRPRKTPWVIDNEVVIATVVSMSLAADHRVSDGHAGARLLHKINKFLQKPETLI